MEAPKKFIDLKLEAHGVPLKVLVHRKCCVDYISPLRTEITTSEAHKNITEYSNIMTN